MVKTLCVSTAHRSISALHFKFARTKAVRADASATGILRSQKILQIPEPDQRSDKPEGDTVKWTVGGERSQEVET